MVLQPHGLLDGCKATCHPAFADRLQNSQAIESRVVTDGRCVTSRGPGTAIEFAIELVALLYGEAKAKAVAAPMMLK